MKNGVQVGRSFYTFPNKQFDLGDFYDLWPGLFQSTILGRILYVNVDISHKAFPRPMSLIELIDGMYQSSRFAKGNINTELDRCIEDQFQKHLKGLRIIYRLPGNEASSKGYKFVSLGRIPASEVFITEDREISVLKYFEEKGMTIEYPKLPCIRVGNSLKTISLPVEFCDIPPGQVSIINSTQLKYVIKYVFNT